ncbi:restriction endonuclease [Bradyrhizobium elkanii]|uniref:restriction endonuclease n=1 Tax=Bradyrhizobium elkanii TaxID=29448 RepID=UPI0030C6E4E9
MDGFAVHPDGLIIVHCKRNSAANRVGRPTVQQFKGVIEEQGRTSGLRCLHV